MENEKRLFLLSHPPYGGVEDPPAPKGDNPPVDDGRDPLEDLGGENPLDAYLRAGEDEQPPAGEKKEEAPPDPRFASMEERMAKAEERAIAAEQLAQQTRGQNVLLQQQLNERGTKKEETPPPTKEPLFKVGSKEELQKQLEADPAGTLLNLLNEFANGLEGRVTKVSEETKGTLAQRDAAARFNTAYQADMKEAMTEFGEETLRNPDFIKDGDAEIAKIVRLRGGDSYLPGDFYTAASRVHARWTREGKLTNNANGNKVTNTNGDNGGARPSLREITRRVSFSDDAGRGDGGDRGASGVKTLRDLGLSPLEERIARQNMKNLGIAEGDWVRNHLAAAREDEGYGR